MKRQRKRMLLIDGHSLLHRAFYALPLLTTAGGEPTNAVYGCATMLLRVLEEERPDAVAAAFDPPGPTFRHKAAPEYKAHRPAMADPLRRQVPLVEELFTALGIPVFKVEGYEADDVLGTLARRAEKAGLDVLILTGDKDVLQLVTDRVEALILRKGIRKIERFDAAAVKAAAGVEPERIADVKGLAGEKSDNIPGVPGIGEKRAVRLIAEFGSVEGLFDRIAEVKGKLGERLAAHRELALQSKWLATIDTEVPLDAELEGLRYPGPDLSALRKLFRRLEFLSVLDRLERYPWLIGRAEGNGALSTSGRSLSAVGECRVVTLEELESLVPRAAKGGRVAFGFVVDGPARTGDPVGIWLARPGSAWFAPFPSGEGERPGVERLLGRLGELSLVVHDAKAQQIAACRFGVASLPIASDVMLAGYLLAPGQGEVSLEALSLKHLQVEAAPLFEEAGRKRPPWRTLPVERLAAWAGDRAELVLRLDERLVERLREAGLRTLYEEVELPLTAVLAEMELRGLLLDTPVLQRMRRSMARAIEALEARIYEEAGEEFNLNSPKQLASILFEKLRLPVIKKAKSGPSTSAEVLEVLAREHEIAAQLLEYRRLQKLKGTYVDTLPALVDSRTGRIHTTFNQTVAATGRLSSANPNLQNIPIRSEAGREIRKAFVASPGYQLLSADYSQIELRVLAHMSGDERLIDAFLRWEDIHAKTASELFGVALEEVGRAQRDAAKAVNFGVIYGISSFGLSRGAGLSIEEAQRFIDEYFAQYPGVARFVEACVTQGRERGYVTTLMGRRRYLPELNDRRRALRKFAERAAVNTPIQGSAADIIKAAMVALRRRLREEELDAHLVLQVHDELLVEVRCEELHRAARAVKETMEGVVTLAVPLAVALRAGPTWYEGTEIKV